jgi:hypothetical protein
MRIATGEEAEELHAIKSAAAELGSRGGRARAEKLSPARRRQIDTNLVTQYEQLAISLEGPISPGGPRQNSE